VRMLVFNSVLFTAITLSHVYTMLFAGLASAFFLLGPAMKREEKKLMDNFAYLFKMYGLAFLLAAFWLVPLAAKLEYTTPYNYKWYVNDWKEALPDILVPFYVLFFVGAYAFGRMRDSRVLFFSLSLLAAAVLYFAAGAIGIVDIRFVPFLQFFPLFVSACGAYVIASLGFRKSGGLRIAGFHLTETHVRLVFLFAVFAATLWWTHSHVTYIDYWIRWNYEGFEAKQLWPAFSAVNAFLRGTAADPRVVYEHSPLHDSAGTTRAFESLPLFSGRSTLEGLYMQSTPTAPFVFYTQSEISEVGSCPFPGYECTSFNSAKAAAHLELFNVKQVIARTDKVKASLNSSSLYRFVAAFEPFEVYELLQGNGHYVVVPEYEPVVFDASGIAGGWKAVAYEWFKREDMLGVPLVFSEVPDGMFRLGARDLDAVPKASMGSDCDISENVTDDSVVFHTGCVGVPHIVKISYFPNWKAEGADGPYVVSPSFMLVVPREPDVRLYYGTTAWDTAGTALTVVGIVALACAVYASFSRSQNASRL